ELILRDEIEFDDDDEYEEEEDVEEDEEEHPVIEQPRKPDQRFDLYSYRDDDFKLHFRFQ
ncbi:hypothetical protein BGX27_004656, partial [Mortierella sp. AM989]